MNKNKYTIGDRIYKYDYSDNSIQELMVNEIIIVKGVDKTIIKTIEEGINEDDIYNNIYYRLASNNYINEYRDIIESEINEKYYFDSYKKAMENLRIRYEQHIDKLEK